MRSICIIVTLLFMGQSIVGCAQKKQAPRLIVRGDDMGFAQAGNDALLKCSKEGVQTCIEVIVPSPWFPQAVKMLKENPGIDVGIHLALTSEWDNMKWRPVSHCPSLTDEDGYLFPFIWPNKNYPGRALLESKWTIEDVEKELRAQIELALKHIPWISHVSGHMGCTGMSPEVRALADRLTKEYNIHVDLAALGVKGVSYIGERRTSEEKTAGFIKMLESLKPGETYMFVDHPALDTPEMRAIHHIGYDDVAIDRQGVTDAWTHPKVKETVTKLGIQLVSYRDLKQQ